MYNDNPWLKLLLRNDSTWTLFKWVLGWLAMFSVIIIIWLDMLDYPFTFFETVPSLACVPVLILSMLIISVAAAVIKRETTADGYQLMYLTNFPALKVLWGLLFAMIIRLRVWIAVFVWGGALAMTTLTVNLATERSYTYGRVGYGYPAAYALPAADHVIMFAAVWTLAGVGMVFMLTSAAVRNALRGVDPLWSALRSVVTAYLLATLGYSLMLAPLVALQDTRWFVAATVLLVLIVLIGGLVAHRWKMHPRFALDVLASDLFGLLMVWLLMVLVAGVVTDEAVDRYYTYLMAYMVVIFLVTGWLRMLGRGVMSGMLVIYTLEQFVVLLYLGLAGLRDYPSILLVHVGLWGVHAVMLLLAILTRTYGRHTMPLLIRAAILTIGVQTLIWMLVMHLLPRLASEPFLQLLYAVIVLSLVGSLVVKRGQYAGLRALVLLLLHLLLIPAYLLSDDNADVIADATYTFVVWGALLAIYNIVLRNIYNSVGNVWRMRLG